MTWTKQKKTHNKKSTTKIGGEGGMLGEEHLFKGVEYRIITPADAHAILIDSGPAPRYKPYGRFLLQEDGIWVAIDNSDGNAWTEEFYNKTVALNWLCEVKYIDATIAHGVDSAVRKRMQTMKMRGRK